MDKAVIILGSSRSNGDTFKVVSKIKEFLSCDIIDLNSYHISYYDYNHDNRGDDFMPLIKEIIKEYQIIILGTPVYWYTMSAVLKTFLDRFSDLLTIEKELGRQLRGKELGVISCSLGSKVDDEFWHPFKKTADYLGMKYLGDRHFSGLDEVEGVQSFLQLLNTSN